MAKKVHLLYFFKLQIIFKFLSLFFSLFLTVVRTDWPSTLQLVLLRPIVEGWEINIALRQVS